jgi:hypothetical protein
MSLVYCNYPILDKISEPSWVAEITNSNLRVRNEIPECARFYHPIHALDYQPELADVLSLPCNREGEFLKMQLALDIQYIFQADYTKSGNNVLTYEKVLASENTGTYSHVSLMKDLWVLAHCDFVVTDCNDPDHANTASISMAARIMGIPNIGVSDKFLNSPWQHFLCDYQTKTPEVGKLLGSLLIAKKLRDVSNIPKEVTE